MLPDPTAHGLGGFADGVPRRGADVDSAPPFDLRIAAARGAGVVALLGPNTTVVVNAGVGPDRLKRLLARAHRRLSDIDAVLLANERAERVAGLPALLQRHEARVFATPGTLRSLSERYAWSPRAVPVSHGDPILCGDFVVTAFDVPGRGSHPVAWRIEGNGLAAVVAVDLSAPDRRLADWLSALDLLVVEAHYDDALLDRGTADQRRVLPGGGGRLSNADAARMVQLASWRPGARVVLVDLDPVLNDAGRARRVVQARASDDLQVGAIPGHADDVRVRFDAKAPPPDDPSSDDPPSATSPHEPPPGAEPEGSRAVEPGDAGPNAPGHDAIPSNSPVTTSSSTTGADAPTGQLALGFGDDPASG